MMDDMAEPYWVDDPNLSREETLKRFEAMSPEPNLTHPPDRLPNGAVPVTANGSRVDAVNSWPTAGTTRVVRTELLNV
jgi:hypothetical protein